MQRNNFLLGALTVIFINALNQIVQASIEVFCSYCGVQIAKNNEIIEKSTSTEPVRAIGFTLEGEEDETCG